MAGPSSSLHKLKILLLGDTATGKHCYVTRLIYNKFPNDKWTNVSMSFSFAKFLCIIYIYHRKNAIVRQQKSKLMKTLKFP
jgi:GTPase SAR1 family protein